MSSFHQAELKEKILSAPIFLLGLGWRARDAGSGQVPVVAGSCGVLLKAAGSASLPTCPEVTAGKICFLLGSWLCLDCLAVSKGESIPPVKASVGSS